MEIGPESACAGACRWKRCRAKPQFLSLQQAIISAYFDEYACGDLLLGTERVITWRESTMKETSGEVDTDRMTQF
jgi:hypothetical protein